MNQSNFNSSNELKERLIEYEAMSQKGTVGFFEETVFFDFINYYKSCNDLRRALEVADHGLHQHHFSTKLYLQKAQLLLDNNQPEMAIDTLDEAVLYAPSEKLHQFRNQLIAELEREQMGSSHFDNFLINKSILDDRFEDLEELYERLKLKLEQNPKDEIALNKMWFCTDIIQCYEDSIEFYLSLINKEPYSYLAWYNLGRTYKDNHQYEDAADALEYAFIIRESFLPAYKAFIDTCVLLSDYDRPLRAFEDFPKNLEPDSKLLTSFGKCYEMKGNYKVASALYRKALTVDGLNADTHYRIGECFSKQEQWNKAIRAYEEAIMLDTRNEVYYAALGDVFAKIHDYNMAFRFLEKAADTAPEIAAYWTNVVTFLMDVNDFDRAWDKLNESMDHVIDHTEIKYCRVACLYRMGDRTAAKKMLTEVLYDHYNQYSLLFDYAPEIEKDMTFIALINICNQN